MNVKTLVVFAVALLAACDKPPNVQDQITDVHVEDFGSDDIQTCRPSDVDLDDRQVKAFFTKAKRVEHKVIHDHYNYAPCYIEGTLKQNAAACEWEIRAGATGHIKCHDSVTYFACDDCDDLFVRKASGN